MRGALLPTLVFFGCSLKFGGPPPVQIQVTGYPPDTSVLPRINKGPATAVRIRYGAGGAPYAVFKEVYDNTIRVVDLSNPRRDQILSATHLYADESYTEFYLVNEPPDAVSGVTAAELTIHYPGESQSPAKSAPLFPVKAGPGKFVHGNNDAFVYWALSPATTTFPVFVGGGDTEPLEFPAMPGVEPTDPFVLGTLRFSNDGKSLFARDAVGDLVIHSIDKTNLLPDRDLGVQPKQFYLEADDGSVLLTCGKGGLRYVYLDGTPDKVLDSECDEHNGVGVDDHHFIYSASGSLYSVPDDGSGPRELIQQLGTHLIGPGYVPGSKIPIYSRDNEDRYFGGAGDGWIGSQRFIERGRALHFSADNQRLFWLDRAATLFGAGDLMTAPIDGDHHVGAAMRLLSNCLSYAQLGQNRLLVWDKAAFHGIQERLIVVDLDTMSAKWVATAADGYQSIKPWDPKSDLLVNVITGPQRYDIVRMSVPPK